MTKEVRKAIMIRSKLRNKFLKDKNEHSKNDYRKQRNLCVALVRRAKEQCTSSLELSLITDNLILFGVPQGSILGPLLFNAYVCDLFFEARDLEYASFADDTTLYSCLPEMILRKT